MLLPALLVWSETTMRMRAMAVKSPLTLEHYPGMTESSIEAIVQEAGARWPLVATTVVHRVGTLRPLDQIVMVLTASAHRDAAFAAAEFIMDYLKTRAIFWKKEASDRGDQWIESTQADQQRAVGWLEKCSNETQIKPRSKLEIASLSAAELH